MKFEKINKQIQQAVDLWRELSFTKLKAINFKGNIIHFYILSYDPISYVFLSKLNELISKKHPIGNLAFYGYKSVENEELQVSSNTTTLKYYKATIFNDTKDIEESEYIGKLDLFYQHLNELLKELRGKNETRDIGQQQELVT